MSTEEIVNAVNEKIIELLPEIMQKILPKILSAITDESVTLMKGIIPDIVRACKNEVKETMNYDHSSTQDNFTVQREVDSFKLTHGKAINTLLVIVDLSCGSRYLRFTRSENDRGIH